ncbi:MAG: hypothetical protein ACI8T1_000425 [Verrucomicrobiales bacterium]|jgi:hypothetical protein
MELVTAEEAALTRRSKASRLSSRVANVGDPRDPITELEERVQEQLSALQSCAGESGCVLKKRRIFHKG